MLDALGNKLINRGGRVWLEIVGRAPVQLGVINKKDREFSTVVLPSSIDKRFGVSFCADFFRLARAFDTLIVTTQQTVYKVPKAIITLKGTEHYKDEKGYERRLFLSLDQLQDYDTKTRKRKAKKANI